MDIQAKKLMLIEWLAALNDKSLIEDLLKLKAGHQRIGIIQYNKELEEANTRIESGEYISHEDLEKESNEWLK
jgi:hypothetical protein